MAFGPAELRALCLETSGPAEDTQAPAVVLATLTSLYFAILCNDKIKRSR